MGFVFSMWVCCICGFFFSMWVCFALIDVGLLRLWDFFFGVGLLGWLIGVGLFCSSGCFFLDGGGWWWLVVGVAVGLLG